VAKTPYLDFWYSVLEIFQYRIPAWDEADTATGFGVWALWREGKGEVAPLVVARFFDDGRSVQLTSVVPDRKGITHAALAKSVQSLVDRLAETPKPWIGGTLPTVEGLTALSGTAGRRALKAATRERHCDAWNTVGDHGLLGRPSGATLAYVQLLAQQSTAFEELPARPVWNARAIRAAAKPAPVVAKTKAKSAAAPKRAAKKRPAVKRRAAPAAKKAAARR
jgi:hypothetical protein